MIYIIQLEFLVQFVQTRLVEGLRNTDRSAIDALIRCSFLSSYTHFENDFVHIVDIGEVSLSVFVIVEEMSYCGTRVAGLSYDRTNRPLQRLQQVPAYDNVLNDSRHSKAYNSFSFILTFLNLVFANFIRAHTFELRTSMVSKNVGSSVGW